MKIVIDSSVIIDYVRAEKGIFSQLVGLARKEKAVLYVPSVVILEIWSGESMKDKSAEDLVKKLLSITKVHDLTRQLAESAGKLAREKLLDSFTDAAIAATALYLDAELATANKKHFLKVKDLKIFGG